MNNYIKLTPEAEQVIAGLRHPAGTHQVYRNTLSRIFNQVLHTAEDLGMGDLEALETLQALDMIRRDLAALATTPTLTDDDDKNTETAEKRDPYNMAMSALALAVGCLGEIIPASGDHGVEIIDIIEAINEAANRLTSVAAFSAAHAESPNYNELHAAEQIRMFTSVAYYNAIGAHELMIDAQDRLKRSGNKSDELAVALKEAAVAQKAAAEAIDYFRGLIYKADAQEEGGQQ